MTFSLPVEMSMEIYCGSVDEGLFDQNLIESKMKFSKGQKII